MKRWALALGVAFFWHGGMARAATPLGLDDVVREAMAAAKPVAVAQARSAASKSLEDVAGAAFMPTVRGTAAGSAMYLDQPYLADVRYQTSATVLSGALSARYMLFDFGARSRFRDGVRDAAEAARCDALMARLDAALRAGSLYFAVLADEERVAAAKEQVGRRKTQGEIVRALVQGGARPTVDIARAELETSSALIAVTSAAAARSLDAAELLAALGRDPADSIELAPVDDRIDPDDASPEAAARSAEAWYPTLARGRALVAQAEANRAAVSAARLPTLSLVGAVNAGQTYLLSAPGTGLSGFSFVASGGLQLDAPVIEPVLPARVRAAESDITVAHASLDAETVLVRLEAVRAALQLRAVTSAQEEIQKRVTLAAKALDAVRGRYEHGVAPLLELVDSETIYAQALDTDIRARQAVRTARWRLLLIRRGESGFPLLAHSTPGGRGS